MTQKTAFKNMYCDRNLLTQIDKVLKDTLNNVFRMFSFHSSEKTLYEKSKSPKS